MSTNSLSKSTLKPLMMDDFFKPWNEWFEDSRFTNRAITMPAVNIREDEHQYELFIAVPGLQRNDIRIDVVGKMLTVSAEKEESKEQKKETFSRQEYSFQTFSRSFSIPEDVKAEMIDARYVDGVLKISMPRQESVKNVAATKRIAVH